MKNIKVGYKLITNKIFGGTYYIPSWSIQVDTDDGYQKTFSRLSTMPYENAGEGMKKMVGYAESLKKMLNEGFISLGELEDQYGDWDLIKIDRRIK